MPTGAWTPSCSKKSGCRMTACYADGGCFWHTSDRSQPVGRTKDQANLHRWKEQRKEMALDEYRSRQMRSQVISGVNIAIELIGANNLIALVRSGWETRIVLSAIAEIE